MNKYLDALTRHLDEVAAKGARPGNHDAADTAFLTRFDLFKSSVIVPAMEAFATELQSRSYPVEIVSEGEVNETWKRRPSEVRMVFSSRRDAASGGTVKTCVLRYLADRATAKIKVSQECRCGKGTTENVWKAEYPLDEMNLDLVHQILLRAVQQTIDVP